MWWNDSTKTKYIHNQFANLIESDDVAVYTIA